MLALQINMEIKPTAVEPILPERAYLTDTPYQRLNEKSVRDLTIADLEEARRTSEYIAALRNPDPKTLDKIIRAYLKPNITGINLARAARFNGSLRVCMAEDYVDLLEEVPELTKIYGTQALLWYTENLKRYERGQKKDAWGKGNAGLARKLLKELTRIITDRLNFGEILEKMKGKTYFEAVVEYLVDEKIAVRKELDKLNMQIHKTWLTCKEQ